MKKHLIPIVLFSLFINGCHSDTESGEKRKDALIEFDHTEHDFGEIEFSSEGVCEFKFQNTGQSPLILVRVRSTCGCTIPEWPKEPLENGLTATIKVSYDTHRVGAFNKSVYVYSNAVNGPQRIYIKGTVKPNSDSQ